MAKFDIKDYKKYTKNVGDFLENKKTWFKNANTFLINYFRWFVAMTVLFLLAVGSLLLLLPKYNEVRYLLESSKEEQLNVFLEKEERLEDLQSVIDSYEKISELEKERVKKVIPERQNREEIFSEMKTLAEQSNLTLRNISVESGIVEEEEEEEQEREDRRLVVPRQAEREEEETGDPERPLPEGVERIRVEAFFVGTNYNSLRSFLVTLENNLTLLDITNISFSPEGNTTNLVFDTYQIEK